MESTPIAGQPAANGPSENVRAAQRRRARSRDRYLGLWIFAFTATVFAQTAGPIAASVPKAKPVTAVSIVASANPVCAGDDVTLSGTVVGGSAPVLMQWLKDGQPIPGATLVDLVLTDVPATAAGNYELIAQSALVMRKRSPFEDPKVVHSNVVALDVLTPPEGVAIGADLSACAGSTLTLTASIAAGSPPFEFQWFKDGSPLVGETASTLVLPNLDALTHDGSYSVEVRNACTVSPVPPVVPAQPFVLATIPPLGTPTIVRTPDVDSICVGGALTYSASVSGGGTVAWQWRKDGVPIVGATGDTFVIASAMEADSGDYDVVATDECVSVASAVAALAVKVPPIVSVSPSDSAVLPGGSATFHVAATGTETLHFQWYHDAVAIPGATSATLVLSAISSLDAGYYDCVVSNDCGEQTSASAALRMIDFAAPVSYAAGAGPAALTVTDLAPMDGAPDLVVANAQSDTLTLRRNDGVGGFAAVQTVTMLNGDSPRGVVGGNFIPGGPTDLAVACPGVNFVKYLDGAANYALTLFIPPTSMPFGVVKPTRLISANFDANPITDLVIVCEGDLFGTGSSAVLSLNRGIGVELPAPPGGFHGVRGAAVADLDQDGDTDIVVSMVGAIFQPTMLDNVLLYENDGLGAFTYRGALSVIANPRAVALADVSGDGLVDVVTTVESLPFAAPGGICVFIHDGQTGIAPARFTNVHGPYSIGSVPLDLTTGDLGGDQIPGRGVDVLAANFASGDLGTYAGFDGVSFVGGTGVCPAGINPIALGIVDVDGDQLPDLVAANASSNNAIVRLAIPGPMVKALSSGCPGPDLRLTRRDEGIGFLVTDAPPRSPVVVLGQVQQRSFVPLPDCALLPTPQVLLLGTADAIGAAQMPWIPSAHLDLAATIRFQAIATPARGDERIGPARILR